MTSFAILAPVPSEHLVSGKELAPTVPYVAYGTNKWKWLRDVEKDRDGQRVPMLLYASHEGIDALLSCRVSWIGWYDGASEREQKALRPSTTLTDSKWAAFWHVAELQELPKFDHLPINEVQSVIGGWRKDAPPRGPERVELPAKLSSYFY